jgi:YHS domain-containing protein
MKSLVGLASVAVLCCLVAVVVAEDKDPLAGVKCPVSGKPVKADATAEYKGGKVYFCCPGCPGAFAKNTDKYAAKANCQLVQTGQAKQVACPLTGRPAKSSVTCTVAGVDVCLCCGGCKGKVAKATGDDQLELVFGKNFDKGFKVGDK